MPLSLGTAQLWMSNTSALLWVWICYIRCPHLVSFEPAPKLTAVPTRKSIDYTSSPRSDNTLQFYFQNMCPMSSLFPIFTAPPPPPKIIFMCRLVQMHPFIHLSSPYLQLSLHSSHRVIFFKWTKTMWFSWLMPFSYSRNNPEFFTQLTRSCLVCTLQFMARLLLAVMLHGCSSFNSSSPPDLHTCSPIRLNVHHSRKPPPLSWPGWVLQVPGEGAQILEEFYNLSPHQPKSPTIQCPVLPWYQLVQL